MPSSLEKLYHFWTVHAQLFNRRKCDFFTDTSDFLVHVKHSRWPKFTYRTTNAVHRLAPSNHIPEFWNFLELCNVFRRFVPTFAQTAAPLKKSLIKNLPLIFLPLRSKEFDAIETIKAALMTTPILALPYSSGHTTIHTDACSVQTGFVPLQKQLDNTMRPIGFLSRTMSAIDTNSQ